MTDAVQLRDATAADAGAIRDIYRYYVELEGCTVTFEEEAPSEEEMAARIGKVGGLGLPYVVAEEPASGRVLGYAYATPFRARTAYRHTVEESVYIAHDARGRGLGRRLLAEVLERCQAAGIVSVMAVLGTREDNPASVGLHEALGFEDAGVWRKVGRRWGQWVDRQVLQRVLS